MKSGMNRWCLATMIALAALPALVHADELPSVADLSVLLQWADTHNPELAATNDEIDAARQRIVPAGALPDPVLRVELMDFAGPGSTDSFNPLPGKGSGTKYTLMQSLPLWGKRDLRREVASAGMEEAVGRRQAALAEVHAKIKRAYTIYFQINGLIRLNDDVLRLLADLEAVVQVRYAGGLVPQQDVIRAQVEKTMLRSERINLEAEQHHAVSKLNSALGRPQGSHVGAPGSLRRISPEKLDAAVLLEKLSHANPQLATQSALITAADANRRLVEMNRYPDVTLGIVPTQRGGSIDTWGAMVEVTIPIRFDTRHAQEGEAGAMLAAAKERHQSIENELAGELQENLAALDTASKQQRLIADTLIPQVELAFRSALAGYEAGKVDFVSLLDAQRAIRRARQDELKAEVEQAMRLSEIEKMIGEEL